MRKNTSCHGSLEGLRNPLKNHIPLKIFLHMIYITDYRRTKSEQVKNSSHLS